MAQGFKSTARGYLARFSAEEASLLGKLFADVALALEPLEQGEVDPLEAIVGISSSAELPQDPAVARLLPTASKDPELADEFRRYTELNLRQQKISQLKMAEFDVQTGQVLLDEAKARMWAAALNDVRLTLGARLNIKTELDSQEVAAKNNWDSIANVEDYMALVYNFVTWLQDTLMDALLADIDQEPS
ncbi:MAG: DUF2017 domain-containing protein [Rothia sp. (in: high G+C Gram-positive bacteria)]|nr:DUF2017 domain-containing protein [Rothia sp. (in: high G+C Gram-positive bacteria)]